jgi:uncharacterized repeat protein (TIGR03803 family)
MLRSSTRIMSGAAVLSLTLSAQTLNTLYSFGSPGYDGITPSAGVILGPKGELYGTTDRGGKSDFGTVYELSPPATRGGVWSETVLHSFDGEDGAYPLAGLVMGPSGALYGVTSKSTGGYGTAFELDPPTDGGTHWPYTVMYQFTEVNGNPSGGLVFGPGGSLYGTTGTGASHSGTVYSLTLSSTDGGPTWTQSTLYIFPGGAGGSDPVGTLALGVNGTLFGVTTHGGRAFPSGGGSGVVFSLAPPVVPGGPWTESLLYGFNAEIGDGVQPTAGLTNTPGGVLYGTTTEGGAGGWGTVFSLSPPEVPGTPMTEAILYAFTGLDGSESAASLVLGSNGRLFGVTELGGANGDGMVFELAPPAVPNNSWIETTLHSFTGGADGWGPNGLVRGAKGVLYGTTANAGTSNHGTVFALTP